MRTDKRQAILAGALTVFARDGYTRANVDAIASAAEVSTRTLYNHFADKARLFQAVMQVSATQAAETQIAVIDRHLSDVSDLETDLVAFGCDLATPASRHAEHFELVKQINAESRHIPQEAIDAWQEAGPLRVRRALAGRLQQLADRGLIRIDDPMLAALHLMLLVTADPVRGQAPTDLHLKAAVRAFLHGYAD